ncbi:MAG: zinc-dependent metalloprotease [Acidimicrobiia bacterium]
MTTTDPVDWVLAERVAVRVAKRNASSIPTGPDPTPDFERLGVVAEALVAAHTGLVSAHGPARIEVVDRAGWIAVNIRAFRRLLAPLLEHYAESIQADGAPGVGRSTVLAVGRRVTGLELGLLLGWMSGRVLGQYDLLVADDDDAAQDIVYVVGPNLISLERRFGFPTEEFRLWLALHELTHRAQFTGVPWMRPYFLEQVGTALSLANPDPGALYRRLRDALTDREDTRLRLREGGLPAVLASPEQLAALGRVGGLMALLEGHGDVTMNRAGAGLVPSAERFSRVLQARRRQTNLVQRMTGIAAKLDQYAAGEHFLAAIEEAAGPRAVDRCWTGPASLPTMEEIRAPQRWIDRLLTPTATT